MVGGIAGSRGTMKEEEEVEGGRKNGNRGKD
jgi:hypothetical protein